MVGRSTAGAVAEGAAGFEDRSNRGAGVGKAMAPGIVAAAAADGMSLMPVLLAAAEGAKAARVEPRSFGGGADGVAGVG